MFQLLHGDALTEMVKLNDKSIDLIAVDLPYGITNNKWDIVIPLADMWYHFNRLCTGAIVLTASQPFASQLIMSNMSKFKYDLIWEKTVASGQLNVKHQQLRAHESILVFSTGKKITYNEQLTVGEPYKIKRSGSYADGNYQEQAPSEKMNTGYRHAKSVIKISNPRIKSGHPTQKPLELMEYVVKTYSNAGETVLDCCMGSGTTGEAAVKLNRKFIGIESNNAYWTIANSRIKCAVDNSTNTPTICNAGDQR